MVDPIGLSMSLSAAEVKALTGWPDPMIQDYLNIIQRLIDYANALTDLQVADTDDQSALAEQASQAALAASRLNRLYARHIDLEQVVSGSQVAMSRIRSLLNEQKHFGENAESDIDLLRGALAGAVARLSRLERAYGWGVYRDTTYSSGSPWTLTGGTAAALPNNAGDNTISFMPPGVKPFYDGSKIKPAAVGDYYILTVRMQGQYSGVLPVLEFRIDVGGSVGEICKETLTFDRGSGVTHPFSIVVPFEASEPFVTNGGTIELESVAGGDVDFWGMENQISRVNAG